MKLCSLVCLSAFVTVSASASILFSDDFNYSNGSLSGPGNVSGGTWFTHSATASQTGQVDVASSRVNLTSAEAEDVSALLSGGPYASGNLYYSMIVNFSVLPAGAGSYFANFRDGTTGFRARLFATTVGATAGSYRLAINNGSTAISATFATDLSLGSDYQAVVRYDAVAVATTLWLNPLLEADPSVSAIDVVTGISVGSISLRQSTTSGPTGMGTLTVDNVRVATTFSEVIAVAPEPTSATLLSLGALVGLFRLRRKN